MVSYTRAALIFVCVAGAVMSSWTSCYKSGTPTHWKGKLNLWSRTTSAVSSRTTKALVSGCMQYICSGGNAKQMAWWHLSFLTFELAKCWLDAPLMRPIKLMSPERAVIIRTPSCKATFHLCNHDNHGGDFKKHAINPVGGHIPCGPPEDSNWKRRKKRERRKINCGSFFFSSAFEV